MEAKLNTLRGEAARFDVVVIGAGPGGCAAAMSVLRQGLSVLLVERARFPREKVCGCCLAPAALGGLDLLGCGDKVRKAGCAVDRICLQRGTRQLVTEIGHGVAMSRSALDAMLAAEVVARGGIFLDGWRARVSDEGTQREQARVVLTPSGVDGDERSVHAKMVIVSDGLTGTALDIERWPIKVSRRARMGVGAIVHAEQVRCAAGEICMHVGSGVAGGAGYVGLVRLEDGRIDVAGALHPQWVRKAGGPGAACAMVLRSAGVECTDFERADFRGTGLLSRQRERVESGRVIVLGDSAGYVEPFTGEGMSWAIAAGVRAGSWVAGRMRADGEDVQIGWEATMRELMHARKMWCRVVVGAVRSDVIVQATLALGAVVGSVLPDVPRKVMAQVGKEWPRQALTGGA